MSVQEKEGELKKRIWELLSDANIGLPYNSEEYPHGTYMDGVKSNDLFKVLEDAKKEYVGFEEEILHLMEQPHHPKEAVAALKYAYDTLQMLDRKWFGT